MTNGMSALEYMRLEDEFCATIQKLRAEFKKQTGVQIAQIHIQPNNTIRLETWPREPVVGIGTRERREQ